MLQTPCEAEYNCPFCRVVDTSHTVCMLPRCPIEWMPLTDNDVYDTLTGQQMPFAKRPEPKKRKEDDKHTNLVPVFTSHAGGRKVQTGLYRV